MKKRIIITIIFVAFGVLVVVKANDETVRLLGNSQQNIQVTKEISKIAGISKVAVLSHGDTVLLGIKSFEGTDVKMIKKRVRMSVSKGFPKHKRCLIGVDSEWADAVLELPFYIDGGMNNKLTEKRFWYLANVGNEIFQQNLTN